MAPQSCDQVLTGAGLRGRGMFMWNQRWIALMFSSVQFSCSIVSHSLLPHEPQHARPPCPSPTPGVHPNPCALSQWCHPTISSSVVPFSCLQSFPASGSFPMSQLFASGGQSIGVSMFTNVHYQLFSINFSKLLQIIIGLLNWYLNKLFFSNSKNHWPDPSKGFVFGFFFFLFLNCFHLCETLLCKRHTIQWKTLYINDK